MIVDNVHSLLAVLAYDLDPEHLDHLFGLVKGSWGGTEQNMTRLLRLIQRLAEEDDGGDMAKRVMELVWSLAHDPDTAPAIVKEAISSMCKILGGRSFREGAEADISAWLDACMVDLQEKRWVVPALNMTEALLDLFISVDTDTSQRDAAIERLLDQHGMEHILDFFEGYLTDAHKRFDELGSDEAAMADAVVFEKASHKATVEQVHKLLTCLVSESRSYLETAEVTRLWELLVARAVTTKDRNMGLRWFFSALQPQADFELEAQQHLLEHEVLKMDFESMPPLAIRCAIAIINNINTERRVFVRNKDGDLRVENSQHIYQLPCLWEIACCHRNEAHARAAMSLISDIFSGLTTSSLPVIRECIEKVHTTLNTPP